MPDIKPEQRWGKHTYINDKLPVPLVAARCPSALDGSNAHRCKLHVGHDGEHLCICSKHWEARA